MPLALVTGASSGIGFHLARELAGRSHDIVGVGASGRIHELPERISGVDEPTAGGHGDGGDVARVDALEDVTGQFRPAKHVVRHMVARGEGRILITTSCSALTPTPYESTYRPARSFMLSFAEGLREEMKEHGVGVTALLPVATATAFHQTATRSPGRTTGRTTRRSWPAGRRRSVRR